MYIYIYLCIRKLCLSQTSHNRKYMANCSVCPWLNCISPPLLLPFVSEMHSAINNWKPEISSVCSVLIVFIAYLQLATIRAITLSQDNFFAWSGRVLWPRGNYTERKACCGMLYGKAYWRYNVLSLFFLIMNYGHASTSDTTQCFKLVVQTGIMTVLPKSEAENCLCVFIYEYPTC